MSANPYAYEVIPPIGRLLIEICKHLSVGGCFRPGNRQLADWMGYASAGHVSYLLSQLACDGWITYDPTTRLITLLRAYPADPVIGSRDQQAESARFSDSALIPSRDRVLPHQDAADPDEGSVFQPDSQCMESLVATTSDSESVVVVVSERGDARGGKPNTPPAAQLMAELGANPKIIRDAYAARPDWTPQQVRERWEYDQKRIAASAELDGKLGEGIFFTALRSGELAPARADPAVPIPVADYADDPSVLLGSQAPPGDEAESIADHARRICPPDASGADWIFVQTRLARGDSDAGAMAALAARRSAVRR